MEKPIGKGVRLIVWSTAISWAGWGFTEALLPVFLLAFAHSYAETGILRSVWDIVYVLTLPLAGALSDKYSAKKLLIIALVLYPLVSGSYFLAGATGIVAFILLARGINGFNYALHSLGRSSYFRRHARADDSAAVFGYFETVANFWWVIASIAGVMLLAYTPLHLLFLLIAPGSLIALLLILKLPADTVSRAREKISLWSLLPKMYAATLRDIRSWEQHLWNLSLTAFLVSCISSISGFFIPLYAYAETGDLKKVVLISAIWTLPEIFALPLGVFADHKKSRALWGGFGILAILFIFLALTKIYLWQAAVALGIGFTLRFMLLAIEGTITRSVAPEHYGRAAGGIEVIAALGGIAGPIVLGFSFDLLGAAASFFLVAILCLGALLVTYRNRPKLSYS